MKHFGRQISNIGAQMRNHPIRPKNHWLEDFTVWQESTLQIDNYPFSRIRLLFSTVWLVHHSPKPLQTIIAHSPNCDDKSTNDVTYFTEAPTLMSTFQIFPPRNLEFRSSAISWGFLTWGGHFTCLYCRDKNIVRRKLMDTQRRHRRIHLINSGCSNSLFRHFSHRNLLC